MLFYASREALSQQQAPAALSRCRGDEQDIFADLDQAKTQFDIKSTMNHANRLLQMIVAPKNSPDVQRSRQVLSWLLYQSHSRVGRKSRLFAFGER